MTSDIRILIASKGNPAALAEGFKKELPEAQIFTDLAALDRGPVPYVVAGKPDPGVIASVPAPDWSSASTPVLNTCWNPVLYPRASRSFVWWTLP